jgi:uncharacterized protein YdhG (YjbR/CyaY superfamily)
LPNFVVVAFHPCPCRLYAPAETLSGIIFTYHITYIPMKKTTPANQPESIDEYIAGFPKEIQVLLKSVRTTIRKAAPKAEEAIKYAIPTFILNGNLVHFAAFKSHIGFYPAPIGMEAFKKELAPYASGKGSVQFPLDKPLPLTLISKIVKFRVAQNLEKGLKPLKKKTKKA